MPTIQLSVEALADAVDEATPGTGGHLDGRWGSVALAEHFATPGFITIFRNGVRVAMIEETAPIEDAVKMVASLL